MYLLYSTVKEVTQQNLHQKIKRAQERHATHTNAIESCNDQIFDRIVESFSEDDLHKAAQNGDSKHVIFWWCKDSTMACGDFEFPLAFLLKGPVEDRGYGRGIEYFDTIGIPSLMTRLREHFHPFKVYVNWNKYENRYNITVSWK